VLAPIERRIGAGTAARLYAVADQGSSGVANIIAFALLGRSLPVGQFGAIGMMIGLHYVIAGFHRSAVVLPFTTDHRGDGAGADAQREDTAWWWLGFALALLLSLAIALAGLAVGFVGRTLPSWRWLADPLLLTALISPSMLVWEFARRWLYKIERADMVSLCSLAYFLALAFVSWAVSRHAPSAFAGALGWVAASLAALAIALPTIRPGAIDRVITARLIRDNRAQAGWLAATNFPYSIYSSASIVVLIGLLVGSVAAAVFSAARTLTNPAISLVSAIDSIDKPRAARAFARDGMAGLQSVVHRSRLSIALATGLYLGLVALFAGPLIAFAFKGQYAGLEREVRLLALGFFLFGLNLPSETMLIVLRAGRTMLTVRTITAIATVAALAIGSAHGVSGMAIAFAITQAGNFVLLRVIEAKVGRRVTNGFAA
jgi:O-antigen/teichoic acid export membrane protein